MSETETVEILAGDEVRRNMLDLADAHNDLGPLWHGWAIMDAFRAGVEWEHRRAADAAVRDAALEEAAQVVHRAAAAMEKANARASTPRAASAGYAVIAGLEAIKNRLRALKSKASP